MGIFDDVGVRGVVAISAKVVWNFHGSELVRALPQTYLYGMREAGGGRREGGERKGKQSVTAAVSPLHKRASRIGNIFPEHYHIGRSSRELCEFCKSDRYSGHR